MSRLTITKEAIERALQSISNDPNLIPVSEHPFPRGNTSRKTPAGRKSRPTPPAPLKEKSLVRSVSTSTNKPRLTIQKRHKMLDKRRVAREGKENNNSDVHSAQESENVDDLILSKIKTEDTCGVYCSLEQVRNKSGVEKETSRDTCIFSGVPATELRYLKTRITDLDPSVRHFYNVDFQTFMKGKKHYDARCKYYVHWKRRGSDGIRRELKKNGKVCVITLENMIDLSSAVRIHLKSLERSNRSALNLDKQSRLLNPNNTLRSRVNTIRPDWTQFMFKP